LQYDVNAISLLTDKWVQLQVSSSLFDKKDKAAKKVQANFSDFWDKFVMHAPEVLKPTLACMMMPHDVLLCYYSMIFFWWGKYAHDLAQAHFQSLQLLVCTESRTSGTARLLLLSDMQVTETMFGHYSSPV